MLSWRTRVHMAARGWRSGPRRTPRLGGWKRVRWRGAQRKSIVRQSERFASTRSLVPPRRAPRTHASRTDSGRAHPRLESGQRVTGDPSAASNEPACERCAGTRTHGALSRPHHPLTSTVRLCVRHPTVLRAAGVCGNVLDCRGRHEQRGRQPSVPAYRPDHAACHRRSAAPV